MSIIKFILKVIAAFVIVIILIGILIASAVPSPQEVDQAVDDIYLKVAEDAEAQYDMVKVSGTAIDKCVQAGMVAAAWLQAQDSGKYDQWKDVEERACANAGVPR